MAVQDSSDGLDRSFPANGDLSAGQFCFVSMQANGQIALSVVGSAVLGVLQNKPTAAGRASTVRTTGTSKLVSGAALDAGQNVMSGVAGRGTASTGAAGAEIGGVVLTATGGSGDYAEILVRPFRNSVV